MKKIAVYCGASSGNSPLFKQAAIDLGNWIVANNFELVYGGGRYGLMGILAETVSSQNGKIYGIIPDVLYRKNIAFNGLTDLKVVPNMSARKETMLQLSDASLALPGGPGTLEEIAQAYSWARIGENSNPCVLYNVNHFFEPLEKMFDSMVDNGFLGAAERKKLLFSDSLPEIREFIQTYTPPQKRTYNEKDSM
ncbi:lysine decarboxylase [Ligilactobacillus salitolerans]|uniref:Cytokinin riboside 5'-monophosphate phosphoribohydrolase n=1 Tax=Ligilactobacillus salitolerans TaxID=1808352 RepID=A0A401IW08_9LACO|nr:TIGR00730 family Rossman fold protein [Ligilactobacillus salitolerans]GBG95724.1 lysine decarboxylase [Ligilactobacillus salitolerans]